MARKPGSVAYVTDIANSIAFYQHVLGLEVQDTEAGTAIIEPEGWPVLLAEPGAGDLSGHLTESYETLKPGATLHRFSADLDSLAQRIHDCGLAPSVQTTTWGYRTLTVTDPDGYLVSFWTTSSRTEQQTIDLYASGPDMLAAALDGLSVQDITWKPAADEWSIREIVHHVVDMDTHALFSIKLALAEPGRLVLGNPFQPDTWALSLDYAQRDIGPALQLLQAIRVHILQLLEHLPDAMQHTIVSAEEERTTVETFISMLASHLLLHVEQIKDVQAQWQADRDS